MSETGGYTTTDKDTPRLGTQGGEGAFVPAEDDPFKGAFVAASDDDNAPSDFNGSFVIGEPDEDEDPDQKKKREAALKAFNEETEKDKDKDNKDTRDHSGEWFSITHRGPRQPATTVRHMTEDQLREILLKAILEKGWTEIWIYSGYSKEINQKLTKQAGEMLNHMMSEGGILHGVIKDPPTLHQTRLSRQKDPKTGKMKVEPWAKGPFQSIHELDMGIRNKVADYKDGRAKRKADRHKKKMLNKFTPPPKDPDRTFAKKNGYGDQISEDPAKLARKAREAQRQQQREEKKAKKKGRRHGGSDDQEQAASQLAEQFGKADQRNPQNNPRNAAGGTNGESAGDGASEAIGETAGENIGAGGKSSAKKPKI